MTPKTKVFYNVVLDVDLFFTFYVSDDIDKVDYENTIRSYLSKNGLPCLSIRFNALKEYKIWSKEEIINCINENKNSFQHERL